MPELIKPDVADIILIEFRGMVAVVKEALKCARDASSGWFEGARKVSRRQRAIGGQANMRGG